MKLEEGVVLSKLVEIKDLRKIWPKEDLNFTRWLAEDENINLLGDACGISITVEKIEENIGDFRSDIFAKETGTDKKIIIENQLEKTDHDHLGKIITYASGTNANTIIWIVKSARDEHRKAIEWLNENTGEDINFFLIEIKLYKIDNSKPAVKFEIIEKPNDWGKAMKLNKNVSEREEARKQYWTLFNDYAFISDSKFSKNFNKVKPSTDHWMNLSVGSSLCNISITQVRKKNKIGVEWYISDNKEIYNELYKNKEKIENELGFMCEWMPLPEKKASRIIAYNDADFNNDKEYQIQFKWIMETALKMKEVMKKYIK